MFASEAVQKLIGPEFEAFVTVVNGFYKCVGPVVSGAYAEQINNYKRLLPNDGVILVSLGQTRSDVDDFLKNNGLDKARAVLDRVGDGLETWSDSVTTDGQKSDANEWIKDVIEAFKDRYERMANTFGMFVQANQDRFIGKVSQAVENQLIFTDVWADRTQRLMDIGMDTRIKDWRANVITVKDQLSTASSQVFPGMRNLPPDMLDSITSNLNEYFANLVDKLDREAQAARDTLDQTTAILGADQMKRDLDRGPLKSQMPS
jgi:hypothetical protein